MSNPLKDYKEADLMPKYDLRVYLILAGNSTEKLLRIICRPVENLLWYINVSALVIAIIFFISSEEN